jgi:putative selenium metabolism protein SsnA
MLLVGNGLVLTLSRRNRIVPDGGVLVDGPTIVEVGPADDLRRRHPDAEYLDAGGRLVMPGLINTHMHLYGTFARGMDSKSPPPKSFGDILSGLWWKLDRALTMEDVYYSALVSLTECVKNGTTTIIDHHASPHAVSGSLATMAGAAGEVGVRAAFCYEVSDRDGAGIATEGIEENVSFLDSCKRHPDPMVAGLFGLHASLTLSDATLERCAGAAAATGTGFHVHVAEGIEDVQDSLAKSGLRVVERFQRWGILGPQTIAAHCVHVDDREIEILKQTGTRVIHNPESNMGNAVGTAAVLKMLAAGIPAGLGTDGYTCDMFESAKVANLLHKHAAGDPSAAWAEVPQMLYYNNADIAAGLFGGTFGALEPGAWADIIVADYLPPTPLTTANWSGHLLFGMSGRCVDTTIVGGTVRMRGRKLTGIDEQAMVEHSRNLAAALWRRI